MLGLSYAIRLSPRIEKRLATLFTPSPSRVGHPGDPYRRNIEISKCSGIFLKLSELFEYLVMTFGLKNAGATYQRAMNYIFHDLIGKLVEIYIDDVVVKSKSAGGHLEDLRQVLERTRRFGLKMNPKKCAFGMSAGQFLRFLVHERGIEIALRVKKL